MIRILEPLIFLSLATGLHVGLWSVSPRQQGAEASGGPGQATVMLAAASAQHVALAKAWTTPPKIAADPAAIEPPHPTRTLPKPHAILPRPALMPATSLPAVVPAALPHVEPPQPRRAPAPKRSVAPAPAELGNPDVDTPLDTVPRVADPATTRRSSPDQPENPRADAPATADAAPNPPPERVTPKPDKPTDQARKPAPSTPAAKAATGGNTAKPSAGRSGQDRTQSTSSATSNALQARWGAKIQRKVHRRLIFPKGTRGAGTAKVALTIDRGGRLTDLRLVRSSGVSAFDDAALGAVRRAGRFPPAPDDLTKANYSFTLSLSFRP